MDEDTAGATAETLGASLRISGATLVASSVADWVAGLVSVFIAGLGAGLGADLTTGVLAGGVFCATSPDPAGRNASIRNKAMAKPVCSSGAKEISVLLVIAIW